MPSLDTSNNKIVVRVVYDGPALAGKTTNVQHLLTQFSERERSELQSPGSQSSRTLFLDWLRVDTGFAAGHPLSCNFLTVPGQRVLSRRRHYLLALADVIVFVATAEPELRGEVLASYRGLLRRLAELPSRPPIVVQLNKTDVPGALTVRQIRDLLELKSSCTVHVAQAHVGQGVKETALDALRLAADAVQDRILVDGLQSLSRESKDANQLREELVEHERQDGRTPIQVMMDAQAIEEVSPESRYRAARGDEAGAHAPGPKSLSKASLETAALPEPSIFSGLIWPANIGRSLLARAAQERDWERSVGEGVLVARGAMWSFSTDLSRTFDSVDDARRALLKVARQSIALEGVRVPRLVWCVTEAPGGRYLLWRLGADPATVGEHLAHALRCHRDNVVRALLEGYLEAVSKVQAQVGAELPCGLQDFGWCEGRVLALQRPGQREESNLGEWLREPLNVELPSSVAQFYSEQVEARFGASVCNEMRRAS